MNDLVSIPQATAAVVNNAHRATQGIRAVVACISEGLGFLQSTPSCGAGRLISTALTRNGLALFLKK